MNPTQGRIFAFMTLDLTHTLPIFKWQQRCALKHEPAL